MYFVSWDYASPQRESGSMLLLNDSVSQTVLKPPYGLQLGHVVDHLGSPDRIFPNRIEGTDGESYEVTIYYPG